MVCVGNYKFCSDFILHNVHCCFFCLLVFFGLVFLLCRKLSSLTEKFYSLSLTDIQYILKNHCINVFSYWFKYVLKWGQKYTTVYHAMYSIIIQSYCRLPITPHYFLKTFLQESRLDESHASKVQQPTKLNTICFSKIQPNWIRIIWQHTGCIKHTKTSKSFLSCCVSRSVLLSGRAVVVLAC